MPLALPDGSKKLVPGIPLVRRSGYRCERLETFLFFAGEVVLGADQVWDVDPSSRAMGQSDGPGVNAVAILKAVEPALGDGVNAVVRRRRVRRRSPRKCRYRRPC